METCTAPTEIGFFPIVDNKILPGTIGEFVADRCPNYATFVVVEHTDDTLKIIFPSLERKDGKYIALEDRFRERLRDKCFIRSTLGQYVVKTIKIHNFQDQNATEKWVSIQNVGNPFISFNDHFVADRKELVDWSVLQLDRP